MMKFYLNKRILIGFFAALAILSWLAITSYVTTKEVVRSSDLVVHTMDVLYNTERVLAITTSIELAQRGYTITGNEAFLRSFLKAKSEIDSHVDNLRQLTNDNARQRPRTKALMENIKELIIFSQTTLEVRKSKGFDSAQTKNSTLRGKQLLDNIRSLVLSIELEEQQLLQARTLSSERQVEKLGITFIALLGCTGLIIVSIFYAINLNLRVRQETELKLKSALNEIRDLYDNAPCGYHSVDEDGYFVNINNTMCNWLGYTKDEVIKKIRFNDVISSRDQEVFQKTFPIFKQQGAVYDIEFCLKRKDGTEFPVILNAVAIKDEHGKYLKSRSVTINNADRKEAEMKVKTLNTELEAFTYSVSHDLRAPLRSIDGYARILQEDFGDKLDAEGKRVLQVIMNNAKRMGKLIDDLLDFARLGRKDIIKTRVNMTLVVNGIVKDLVEQEKNRNIEFKIGQLHDVPVDVDMIRQVWENLLSNAIKYSSKKEKAIIEVRSEVRDDETIYTVRDNGVGFDMAYVGKLFGVFQRLHKVQEFSGTGVGLALVKRIVERHNGTVWAEGKQNEGATFYFSIPN